MRFSLLLILGFLLYACEDESTYIVKGYDIPRDPSAQDVILRQYENAHNLASLDFERAKDSFLIASRTGYETGYPYFAGQALLSLADYYLDLQEPDSALHYAYLVKDHPYTLVDDELTGFAYSSIIRFQAHDGRFEDARTTLAEQLQSIDTTSMNEQYAAYLLNTAKIAQMEGDKVKQIKNLTDVLGHYREELAISDGKANEGEDTARFVETSYELAIVLFNNGSTDKAIPYLREGLVCVNLSQFAHPFLDNVAGKILGESSPSEGIFYHQRAINNSPPEVNPSFFIQGHTGIANIYLNNKDYLKAKAHIDTLNEFRQEIPQEYTYDFYSLLTRYYLETGDPQSASNSLNAMSDNLSTADDSLSFRIMAESNKLLKISPDAAIHISTLRDLQDSLTRKSVDLRIEELETKYQIAVKDGKIATSAKTVEIEKAKARQYLVVGLIAAGAALLLAFLLWVLRQRNMDLLISQAHISRLNQEINHRATNNLRNVKLLLKDQRARAVTAGLDDSAVNELERKILAYTKLQEKLNTNLNQINLASYLNDFCEHLREAFSSNGKPVHFNRNIANVEVSPDFAAPLALIINELATNSLKYAKREDGILSIYLDAVIDDNDELRVYYRDGGPADGPIDPETCSSGQGMELVKDFTEQLEGVIVKYGAKDGYDFEAVFALAA